MMSSIDDERYIKLLDSIPVPQRELEQAIYAGQRLARLDRQRERKAKYIKRSFAALLATIVLFGSLIVGSRWSPVLAKSLSQIPFVSELVELVASNSDKGMKDIVEHEYYEIIDKTVSNGELSLTLKGVIADEYGLVLFYRFSAGDDAHAEYVDVNNVELTLNGRQIEGGISYGSAAHNENKLVDDRISVQTLEPINYDANQFELQMAFTDESQSVLTIPFELHKPIAKTKVYPLEEEIVVSGQRLRLQELSISPMRAQLTLTVDEQNSWQILDIGSAELIDEQGESWGKAVNSVIGWGSLREGKYSLNFQSNYFRDPQQLTLKLADISALPKGEDYIEIDFDKQKVLYMPQLVDVELNVLPEGVAFTIEKNAELFNSQLISWGIDAAGQDVYSRFSSYRTTDGRAEHQISFDLEGVVNPVRFNIAGYPNFLPDAVEVELPLTP